MNKILFREEQQFRQWYWVLLILGISIPLIIFSIYALYQQTVKGIQVGDHPAPNGGLIVQLIFMILLPCFFFMLKLEIWIDSIGIHYRFFPLIFKEKVILKEEIKSYEIRKYNALIDYGGWGVRRSFWKGKAYNVSGNIGLQLYLTNGKKVLFGTQRSQAILYAMDTMMEEKHRID